MELRDRALARVALPLLLAVALLTAAAPALAAELTTPASETDPPASFKRSAQQVKMLAARAEKVREERREGPMRPAAYTKGFGRWQVSYFRDDDEVAQVQIDDATGAIVEQWNGSQVAWSMARGYEGAFGRKLNAPYVWIPLCLLFLAPFLDWRRPLRLLHLDLLVLVGFGASHVFFNRGEIGVSVPLVYPVMLYLLLRVLLAGFRPRSGRGPLLPHVPVAWLLVGIVFLAAFRIGLNVTDSNVIDVGYAGVIGADRIVDGDPLYGPGFAQDVERGDTYGPLTYLLYVPFEQALPWSGSWDDLPAARGAAIVFDLLTLGGLFLLGRRLRPGRDGLVLGTALAWAWVAYPYTAFALETNSNDTLVALFCVLALLALTIRREALGGAARGAAIAAGTAAKFAPIALAPLFLRGVSPTALSPSSSVGPTAGALEHGSLPPVSAAENPGTEETFATAREPAAPQPSGGAPSWRGPAAFVLAFGIVLAALVLPFLPDGGPRELYDRTIGYQAGRPSPFSVWGQVEGLDWLQSALKVVVVGLGLLVAFVPRRRDARQVAALGAAVLIVLELTMTHWFYLYVVWFVPFVLLAVLGAYGARRPEGEPPAPSATLVHEPAEPLAQA